MSNKALETGPLERLFNGTSSARILDFLIVFRDFDYSKREIAENSGVSFRHALREIDKLERLQLITQTRSVGHAKMYKLSTENPIASLLQKFTLDLSYQEYQKTVETEPTQKEQCTQTATVKT